MDPLSALAIAAAAFQFLDLGGKFCVKAWEKYKQMQRNIPDDQKLAEEEELGKAFEDLSFQITWIRQVSANIMVSQPPTPVQVQLLELSSECSILSGEFERIKSQMRLPNSRERNSDIHLREHVSFDRRVQEKDCRECLKREDEEIAKVQRNEKDIESMRGKLEPLKRKIMDFIFISLWDDSKRTKQWELHFSNQLDTLIELLGDTEKLTMNTRAISTLSNQQISTQDRNYDVGYSKDNVQESGTAIPTVADEEIVRLRNVLQPLIQPGKGPVSLKQLAAGIIEYLTTDSKAMNAIRRELVHVLWRNDWKLDTSMVSAKIDTTMVAHAIATGIQFTNIQTREDAISKNVEKTFSWIFQGDPPKKDGMPMPMWDSFPKWLENDSEKVYWITGKPGSGKSTIMKLILQDPSVKERLSQSLGSLRLLLVKYYAWLSGNTLQRSIKGLKRTIIFQALKQYPDLAPVLAPRCWAFCQVLRSTLGLPTWETWEIEESFEALLSLCGETIKLALFIDGLDEFDIPPFEVIKCIQHMMIRCPNGLKICAASRPWPEFQDEFNESPMLQMHLLRENDTKIFINEKFKSNRGFAEQSQLYPEAASQLQADIAQRANGVFLWVSIVVQLLSNTFSEGESIPQARKTLEALPTNISSLYDAIWAGILPKNRPDASYMIQVLRAFDGSMPWLTLWIIEELRFAEMNTIILPKSTELIEVALKSLTRKLAARTRCILELSGSGDRGVVDFIHRTARDWALQPENWLLICSSCSGEFDPHLCILKTDAFFLSNLSCSERMSQIALWKKIETGLLRASKVKDISENALDLVNCLNSFEEIFKAFLHLKKISGKKIYERTYSVPRYSMDPLSIWYIEPTFLALTAQFCILPYIKAVALSGPSRLSKGLFTSSIGLLESAIFGFRDFSSDNHQFDKSDSGIPRDQRLATVRYLLEQGVYQSKVRLETGGRCGMKKMVERSYHEDPEYYSAVAMYLDNRGFKSHFKPIELNIRWLFSKLWA